jgi:hypothetical protein
MTEHRDLLAEVNPRSKTALVALVFIVPMALLLSGGALLGVAAILQGPRPPTLGVEPLSTSGEVGTVAFCTVMALFFWYAASKIIFGAITGRAGTLLPWWAVGFTGGFFLVVAIAGALNGAWKGDMRRVAKVIPVSGFAVLALLASGRLRRKEIAERESQRADDTDDAAS